MWMEGMPGVWRRGRRYYARYSLRGRWVYLGAYGTADDAWRVRQLFAKLPLTAKRSIVVMAARERVAAVRSLADRSR